MKPGYRILFEDGRWLRPNRLTRTDDPDKALLFHSKGRAEAVIRHTPIIDPVTIEGAPIPLTEAERKQAAAVHAAFEKRKPRFGYRMEIWGGVRRVRIR